MISKKEEAIYNSYLYASRSAQNKPTRFRKDFSKLKDEDFVAVKKLSLFFNKHSNINYHDWFIAPFKVYSKDDYYDLRFYNTRKALKCYTIYMKEKEVTDPDSEESIKTFKEGLKFVVGFCKTNQLTLPQYINHITGNMPTFVLHLQEHKVNFYLLHALKVDSVVKTVESSVLNFIVQDFFSIFSQTRTKFYSSTVLKLKAKNGIKIITDMLDCERN